MPSTNPGRADTRASSTDLDLVGAPYQFTPFIHRDPAPVVLHLLQARHSANLDFPTNPTVDAIAAARSVLGIDPLANSVWMDPLDWFDASLPRGVPWSDYPVLGNPRSKTYRNMPVPAIRFRKGLAEKGRTFSQTDLAHHVGTVVVHRPTDLGGKGFDILRPALEWASLAMEAARNLGPGADLVVVGDQGTSVQQADELAGHVAGHAPWRRFHYSYAANFVAIAAKSLERHVETNDKEGMAFLDGFRSSYYTPSKISWVSPLMVQRRLGLAGISNPLTLQVLYGLRRRGQARLETSPWGAVQSSWFPALLGTDAPGRLEWTGSGRHPARPLDFTEAEQVAFSLARLLLLRSDGKALSLSQRGEAFLRDLHPDCEDPDMPLRWARHPLTESDATAMDAWIGRTFRKMKARINELP